MAYVYRHVRIDKNEPFYIGVGLGYACKELGIHKSCISEVIKGKQKTAGGYFWTNNYKSYK